MALYLNMPAREKPILMSAPMVRALLDGRKTRTRRVVKLDIEAGVAEVAGFHMGATDTPPVDIRIRKGVGSYRHMDPLSFCEEFSPYGQPGDRLWVKETFYDSRLVSKRTPWTYRADTSVDEDLSRDFAWKPSIFMPRIASRITLEITGVRVERLQEISEADAEAEGVTVVHHVERCAGGCDCCRGAYRELWESINGKCSWEKNPFCWVIGFRKEQT